MQDKSKIGRTIHVGGHELLFVSGGVRRINLRVRKDGLIRVSAPRGISQAQVERFAREHMDWIEGQLLRLRELQEGREEMWAEGSRIDVLGRRLTIRAATARHAQVRQEGADLLVFSPAGKTSPAKTRALCTPWLKEVLAQEAQVLLELNEALMGVRHERLRLRWMKTRWGSCNVRSASICLNLELALRPRACLESVVVHELCHLLEPSHNARFYALMDHYLPSWREGRELLRRHPPSR